MDNYLSHRWPKGAGVQPPPVPAPGQYRPPAPRGKHHWRKTLVVVVCVVLSLGLLCGVSFWSVNSLSAYLDSVDPPNRFDDFHDFPAFPSFSISHSSDWTPDDLPWDEPAPSVQLSLADREEEALSAPDIYERILPSIVYINVKTAEGGASGAGVIVTQSGYVLTNYHVIEESTRIEITLLADQSRTYNAKVVGFDEEFDIAVLKFTALGLTPAPLGDSDALRVGETVYAVGNPMGFYGTMTDGIVSALNRDSEVDDSGMGYIQISVPINPGNSGGALINDRGQVVGITAAKITGLVMGEDSYSVEDAAVIEAIGLALPTSDLLPFINHILATGESFRPSIGIKCVATRQYGQTGVLVREVTDGVPAQKAGLVEGDFIIQANGQPVSDLIDLRRVLYRTGVDGEVTCTVLRNGEELELSFTLIDSPPEE